MAASLFRPPVLTGGASDLCAITGSGPLSRYFLG